MRPFRPRWCAAKVTLALAATAAAGPAEAAIQDTYGATSGSSTRPAPARIQSSTVLDLPYEAQEQRLCGGAAAAMVLRYWGDSDVRAEEFGHLVRDELGGIAAVDLISALEERGWEVVRFSADGPAVRDQLEAGRPVIALIRTAPGRRHYVVLTGWLGERVVIHDPAVAPYRLVGRSELFRAWTQAGGVALTVLPGDRSAPSVPPGASAPGLTGVPAASERGDGSRGRGAAGRSSAPGAEDSAGEAAGDRRAARLRELAGMRLLEGRYEEAIRAARAAASLAPGDAHAARTLRTALYLADRPLEALAAWELAGSPEIRRVRIAGLRRVRDRAARTLVPLEAGGRLTASRRALAERRLSDLPAAGAARVAYVPQPEDGVDVVATVLERPGLPDTPLEWGKVAVASLLEEELRVDVPSPFGAGELWSGIWRWETGRPRLALGISAPSPVFPGQVWALTGAWERETYAGARLAAGPGVRREIGAAGRVVQERRRARLTVGGWASHRLRWFAAAGLDRWEEDGDHVSLGSRVEMHLARDRVRAWGEAVGWRALGEARPFATAGAGISVRSSTVREGLVVEVGGAARYATPEAQPSVWPRAGPGSVQPAAARAHPLIEHGIIVGEAFDRFLVTTTAELLGWLPLTPLLRIGAGPFVDLTYAAGRGEPRTLVDAGLSFRGSPALLDGRVVLSVGLGLTDGAGAVSVSWSAREDAFGPGSHVRGF